jgi:hypothetical protein
MKDLEDEKKFTALGEYFSFIFLEYLLVVAFGVELVMKVFW